MNVQEVRKLTRVDEESEYLRLIRERQEAQLVTGRCAWCDWTSTGPAGRVLEEQREHVKTHPEWRAFDRKRKAPPKTPTPSRPGVDPLTAEQAARGRASSIAKRTGVGSKREREREAKRAQRATKCDGCGGPIPDHRRADARYCTDQCSSRVRQRRREERLAA